MSVFLAATDRVLVQGMTGFQGRKHTGRMLAAGTRVVAGVTPRGARETAGAITFDVAPLTTGAGAAGARSAAGPVAVPVYTTVAAARAATGASVSVVFVPAPAAKDAVIEAVDAGIRLVIVITEGIPLADTIYFCAYAAAQGARIVGPNCPGLISPGHASAGTIPPDLTGTGPIGLVSKSGTLTYEFMHELREVGFSTCIGIGGDPVVGTDYIDALAAFEADPDTELVILVGEIGGDAEERAAAYIRDRMRTPVVAYVAGFTAPVGHTMGHAGAIISGASGTARAKRMALEEAGVLVGLTPAQTATIARGHLQEPTGRKATQA
ncbi:succinate--CoA ligase subunit alpha [Actinomyces sp. MRS3W]|uniref:succinate--CoA ligase subunit alpha n=1 Tax=Actinomyces sp. MRS3W TaxID=2800796 RepID=UPI0028FDB3C3|nr:succinate--CoA ligase subunit alpha [Actinomyces sp. MRS3W]MDU0349598.1 succinate--CoA ligase subunit alpha [Actinomyces sp. MRS3W]